ncbi:hypothetical protein GALL_366320 [mine drainage metagenome]|uniref:Uncharacterized protein n=1 Tax=mine drainage metagenome TaxID=410659 RepID=A0A1J5QDR5_9ZZZZ
MTQRAAQTEIEEGRVAVGRDRRVARHAQRLVLAVGEQRRQPVPRRRGDMAGRAVAAPRIGECEIAAHFLRTQLRLALQPRVVLAVEGVEARILDLVAGDREQRLADHLVGVGENPRPEQLHELRRQRTVAQDARDALRRSGVHFGRIEQRPRRLRLQAVGAAVPEQSALRHPVGRRRGRVRRQLGRARVRRDRATQLRRQRGFAFLVVGTDRERPLPVQIGQRRRRPQPRRAQLSAAGHHRRTAWRRVVAIGRVVARHARQAPRRRQRAVVEQLAAQPGHRRQRLRGRQPQRDRRRIVAARQQRRAPRIARDVAPRQVQLTRGVRDPGRGCRGRAEHDQRGQRDARRSATRAGRKRGRHALCAPAPAGTADRSPPCPPRRL